MEAERGADARRRVDRRALAVSLSISVVLHALVLQIPLDRGPVNSPLEPDGPRTFRPLDAIRVLELDPPDPSTRASGDVATVRSAEAGAPPEPVERATLKPESAEPEADRRADSDQPTDRDLPRVPGPRSDSEAATGQPRHGSRLAPGPTQPRLWRPVTSAVEVGTSVEGRLHSRLDSLVLESDGVRVPPAGDMSVWTARDRRGDRWGVSPGRIHLGTVTIPICGGDFDASNCGFGVPPSFREEYRHRVRAFLEIRMQSNYALVQERARATRARLDRARDSVHGPAPKR